MVGGRKKLQAGVELFARLMFLSDVSIRFMIPCVVGMGCEEEGQ